MVACFNCGVVACFNCGVAACFRCGHMIEVLLSLAMLWAKLVVLSLAVLCAKLVLFLAVLWVCMYL